MEQQKSFILLALLFSIPSFSAEDPAKADTRVPVAAEVLVEPKPGKIARPHYPLVELEKHEQGWVYVQMMIAPNGKPYEVEIHSSSGNKEFEKRALESTEASTFIPATLNGKPIDSMVMMPFYFSMPGETQARPVFKKSYLEFLKTVDANDRSAADAALAKLQPRNLYEKSYYGLAKYGYAAKWGTESDQLLGLREAVAEMTTPVYLEKDAFIFAVRSLFIAEAKAQNYSAALSHWNTLKTVEKNSEALKPYQTIVANIEALRTDPRPYTVKASLDGGTWSFGLFRNKFFIKVVDGRVSQIKLYCEKKFVLFPFDPTLEYKVEEKFGKCSMVVYGDGGTNIELTQKT